MTNDIQVMYTEATPGIPLGAADQANIDAYLGAGERRCPVDVVWKVCVGLKALTAVAWTLKTV
jgi:hypothetical protein